MRILNSFVDLGLVWMSEKIKDKIKTEDNLEWKKI